MGFNGLRRGTSTDLNGYILEFARSSTQSERVEFLGAKQNESPETARSQGVVS